MGEVWRARDSKLGREVAIKTLPEEFAQDEERLARFEREAKLLASLNHPNIATIHGLEEDSGTRFLVLELVEGDTLADRLKRGAIPVEETLKLALQITEALEAAHEKGVIHRDLKPANIKVTPDGKIKVLDFGLAKAFMGDGSDVNLSQSPTLSIVATQQGVILGTAAYMSPEQARGESTDQRADVWAFGVVLFEMLTGRVTFDGKTISDTLASLLKLDPEWKSLPPNLHPRLRLLLERCVAKESKDRYHGIADARVDIQKVLADPAGVIVQPVAEVVPAIPRSKLPWIVAIVVVSAVVGVAVWMLKPEDPRPVRRWVYDLPDGTNFTNGLYSTLSLAPDGTRFAFATTDGVYLRTMNELEARLLPRTQGGLSPFFSPDSQTVGLWRDGQIETISITGGSPSRVGQSLEAFGFTWNEDGTILFAQTDGIYSVAASGGSPERIIDAAAGEQLDSPQLLPDGRSVLFTAGPPGDWASWASAQIVVESLDSAGERTVLRGGHDARSSRPDTSSMR